MLSPAEHEEIAVSKEACLAQIKLGEALERLNKNKDFKLLITDGYQRDYSARQVSLLADPGASKEVVVAGLQGISELLAYCRAVEHGARIAKRTYDEHVELEVGDE